MLSICKKSFRGNLSREQRRALIKAEDQADRAALKAFFTGDGSRQRLTSFALDVFLMGSVTSGLFIGAMAVGFTASLLFGPSRVDHILNVQNWLVGRSIDQVIIDGRYLFWHVIRVCFIAGWGSSLISKFGKISRLARKAAIAQYKDSVM